ncbi:MAG: hypothetical protein ACIAQZ_01370 [Sedimentisphaeraceae bacterium JB056]
MKNTFLVISSTLLILLSGTILAVSEYSNTWEGSYEASTSPTNDGWTGAGLYYDMENCSNGILTLDSYDNDKYGYYYLTNNPAFDFSQGATVEFRAKVNISQGSAIRFTIRDSNNYEVAFEILTDRINFTNMGTCWLTTTDAYHTFRLHVKTGTNQFKVYIDNNSSPLHTASIPTTSGGSLFQFGDYTTPNDSDWDIDYIRWTNTDSYEPAAITADSATWENSYEADDTPDNCGWTTGGTAPTVSNGLAAIDTYDNDTVGYWTYDTGSCLDFSTGATLEIRAKVNECQGGATTSLYVTDTTGRLIFMELQETVFNFSGLGTYAFDTTDAFHTYRISMGLGTDNIKLYIDGNETAAYTRTYGTATAAAGTFRIGDLTGVNDADWEIDYIRWTDTCAMAPGSTGISHTWEGIYEADNLPSSEGWTASGYASTVSTCDGAILNMDTFDNNQTALWTLTSAPAFDFDLGATIEFRAKTIKNASETGGFKIIAQDSNNQKVEVSFANNKLSINGGTEIGILTDAYEIYRLAIKSETNNIKLYIGDKKWPVITGTVTTGTGGAMLQFGDNSTTADAEIDIDYIRWTCSNSIVPPTIYITDMSEALPATATSTSLASDKWYLIPYETGDFTGTMATASSLVTAPELTIPLNNASGWHAIYIGFWSPIYLNQGDTATLFRAKLTGDNAFIPLKYAGTPDSQTITWLKELHWGIRDLTGKNLIITKPNGAVSKQLNLAYVKLVPLSEPQAQAIRTDRATSANRNLTAVIDGMTYFYDYEVGDEDDAMDILEPYRYSDVEKVLWAVNYGERTNYPSTVTGTTFMASTDSRLSLLTTGYGASDYVRSQIQMYDTLNSLSTSNIIIQDEAADYAHSMGLDFDIMIRLGMIGGLDPWLWDNDGFVNNNPAYRQKKRSGRYANKASYAYSQTRAFVIDIIEESLGLIDADGVNLCFVRGPHFLQYEQPIADKLYADYSVTINQVDDDDYRLIAVKEYFMNLFVEEVRTAIDAIDNSIKLSVWVWPQDQTVWCGSTPEEEGLDVEYWIEQGWIDAVICQEGIDAGYKSKCATYGCEFIYFSGYHDSLAMSTSNVASAYDNGVDKFAYFDIDCAQINPESWAWISRIGHEEEMYNFDAYNIFNVSRLIRLYEVNDVDVYESIEDAVYSGG